MRQNIKERLNKKLSNNDMAVLDNKVASTPIVLSDVQQEQLQRDVYENYSTLQEVEPYPGYWQTIVSDDGKLGMVLLFTFGLSVGLLALYVILKSKNKCEVDSK